MNPGCGPGCAARQSTGPPKLEGGGRSAGSLAGDVLRGGQGAGAGVSPCLLHQDSCQTPEHLCIQLHLQQARQDIYLSDGSWIVVLVAYVQHPPAALNVYKTDACQ